MVGYFGRLRWVKIFTAHPKLSNHFGGIVFHTSVSRSFTRFLETTNFLDFHDPSFSKAISDKKFNNILYLLYQVNHQMIKGELKKKKPYLLHILKPFFRKPLQICYFVFSPKFAAAQGNKALIWGYNSGTTYGFTSRLNQAWWSIALFWGHSSWRVTLRFPWKFVDETYF